MSLQGIGRKRTEDIFNSPRGLRNTTKNFDHDCPNSVEIRTECSAALTCSISRVILPRWAKHLARVGEMGKNRSQHFGHLNQSEMVGWVRRGVVEV